MKRLYRILIVDENGHRLGYYQQRYYIFRCLAARRARILAKSYRYRTFHVEATR